MLGKPTLGPGAAQLAGWGALAVVHQVVIALRLPSAPAGTLALHHAYDAGQLLTAGFASWGAVELARRAGAKLRLPEGPLWPSAAALAVAVFAVSLATVERDVANAAGRHGVPVLVVELSASAAFAGSLGASAFLRHFRAPVARALMAAAGVAICVANAFVLPRDYAAFHLMVAWFAALLLAYACEGAVPALPLGSAARRASVAGAACLTALSLFVPPSQLVLRRLQASSSAAVAPFAARFWPDAAPVQRELVPPHVLASPWFRQRKKDPPTPPTGALEVPEPRIVVLLTIDALRADVLSDPRHLKKLPRLASLRRRAAYFSEARAPASSTRPSMASLFTGRYYSQLRFSRRDRDVRLRDGLPRFPELVTRAGVHTVSLPLLGRVRSSSGIALGFREELVDRFDARGIVSRLIGLIEKQQGRAFYFAHFGEPHAPYEGDGDTPFERYLGDVQRVDKEIGRFVQFLRRSGRAKHTLLVISADHGEAFGEHGVGNHARVVYEEVARIPLLVIGPGVVPREISEPVSLIDVAPTILDAFGLPAPGYYMGQSLLPLAAGQDVKLDRPIAIQATNGLESLYVRAPDGTLKVIFDRDARTIEVYDLAKDPGERENLVESPRADVPSAIETAKLFSEIHGRLRWSAE